MASDLLRSQVALEAEILVLRQQINVLRRANPPPHQIFGHAGLADIDAKLEKLAMDPRCSPQRIGAAHLAMAQMAFAEHHGMIEAFPADRADQPLCVYGR